MIWGKNNAAPNYERLRVVVGDGNPDTAAAITAALHLRGVTEVIQCYSTERLGRALDEQIIDLVIYDYHMLDDQFGPTMQRIRRKEMGRNPFVTIIATLREAKADTVRRLINAGVDDLISVPVSIDRIFESIEKSARRRRPFVVTHDYVGPARPGLRDLSREGVDICLAAPNTLRSRAFDGTPEDEILALVAAAVSHIVARQLETCGIEIDRLAHCVADGYDADHGWELTEAMRGDLGKMAEAANDLSHRAAGTASDCVSDLAAAFIPIARRILVAPTGRATVEVRLLSQLAAAVRMALSVDIDADSTIRAIADAVSGFSRDHRLTVA